MHEFGRQARPIRGERDPTGGCDAQARPLTSDLERIVGALRALGKDAESLRSVVLDALARQRRILHEIRAIGSRDPQLRHLLRPIEESIHASNDLDAHLARVNRAASMFARRVLPGGGDGPTVDGASAARPVRHDAATGQVGRGIDAGDRGDPIASSPPAAEIGPPDGARVRWSHQDLDRVAQHLSRLWHSQANDAMISRLRDAIENERDLTEGEENFMIHELTEAKLMDGGMNYDDAHLVALRTHPLMKNYDPEVIEEFPELFNNNWRRTWGLEPR